VLTASSKFLDTLDNIVKGLNKAGFSGKDFKVAETIVEDIKPNADPLTELSTVQELPLDENVPDMFQDIDTSRITAIDAEIKTKPILNEIEQTALQQEQAYEENNCTIRVDTKYFLTIRITIACENIQTKRGIC
jgi:type III restriction enzyme